MQSMPLGENIRYFEYASKAKFQIYMALLRLFINAVRRNQV